MTLANPADLLVVLHVHMLVTCRLQRMLIAQ
jgi:hypothetical protein